ncbi:MAG: hypothetical protein DRI56_01500 [Chloroflexota bacterium]|nr:MAG: hypothetical protein B6243_11435 [Anaerolineaceae bacterium 4572_5.2]RLD11176.1 MAG: hypothetical protein DRI56_01500 [Chloroflexota bacterium]
MDSLANSVFQDYQRFLLLPAAQSLTRIIMRMVMAIIVAADIIATDIIKKTCRDILSILLAERF